MPIQASRLIRKMRGGTQAHLLECTDGGFYVVKFVNNPQHRRILVNEWLANSFLRHLQIYVPDTSLIEVSPDFIANNSDLHFVVGAHRQQVTPGLHFGSKIAVHPNRVAIFDFMPDKLLGKVDNRHDFLGSLVFDKWVGNSDSRQAVFFRANAKTSNRSRDVSQGISFWAQMIDHGFAFNGQHWQFVDSPLQGLYFQTSVYNEVQSLESFQPWLDLVKNFPLAVLESAWREIPSDWLADDNKELEKLLDQLMQRRRRVGELLQEVRDRRSAAFANWR